MDYADGANPNHVNECFCREMVQEAMAVEQSVDLYPGDVLFIPEGWWHQVGG